MEIGGQCLKGIVALKDRKGMYREEICMVGEGLNNDEKEVKNLSVAWWRLGEGGRRVREGWTFLVAVCETSRWMRVWVGMRVMLEVGRKETEGWTF